MMRPALDLPQCNTRRQNAVFAAMPIGRALPLLPAAPNFDAIFLLSIICKTDRVKVARPEVAASLRSFAQKIGEPEI
jgi:hypothetical protein